MGLVWGGGGGGGWCAWAGRVFERGEVDEEADSAAAEEKKEDGVEELVRLQNAGGRPRRVWCEKMGRPCMAEQGCGVCEKAKVASC